MKDKKLQAETIFKNPVLIVVFALVCCALWGSAFPCIKIGYAMLGIDTSASQILFAGYRFFLAGIFTFILGSILEKRVLSIKRSSVLPVFGQGILQTAIQYIFFYIGLAHTTGAKGSVLNASSTFFSILLAHFLLKDENLTLKKAAGCAIGFSGVIAVNLTAGGFDSSFSLMGEGFVLICSAAYGASSVTLKLISDKETPTAITAFQLLSGGAILIIIGFALGGDVSGFNLKSTLLLLYLALLSTVAFSLWSALLKYNQVGKIAVFGFSIPVFGVAMSGLFLKEDVFTLNNAAALILVSAGIILVNLKTKPNT